MFVHEINKKSHEESKKFGEELLKGTIRDLEKLCEKHPENKERHEKRIKEILTKN